MAQKRPNPTHKDSLIVRQRDLARAPLPSPSSSPSGRGLGEGAQHEQTIADNLAGILEA